MPTPLPFLSFALLQAAAHVGPAPQAESPAAIVATAPASAWADIPDDELLVMELAGGRRVAIQLAAAFAPAHVANIRALATAGWWDGTSVNRVQDNYVVQWGDATEKKPLPAAVVRHLPAEYEFDARPLPIHWLDTPDAYAERVGFLNGWPVSLANGLGSLVHCYGMVGVGRDLAPDTGTGAELYTVIGHAPRHLDRNIALVGRVVDGIERLSSLPRGSEGLGFYKTAAERVSIVRLRLASAIPAAERPHYQALRTDDPVFADYIRARANRRDAFFVRPAGGADICNMTPPVRRRP